MKILLSLTFCVLGVLPTAWAAPEEKIQVDDSNFKQIFESQLQASKKEQETASSPEQIAIGFSYLRPQELRLQNDYFSVDHGRIKDGIPSVQFGGSFPVANYGKSAINFRGQLGYGFYESPGSVMSKRGLELKDNVSLQILPLAAGVEFKRYLNDADSVSVSATPLLGTWYIDQKGELDGMNQAVWLNHWAGKFAFGFLESSHKSGANFQGLTAGVTYFNGFGSANTLKGMSYDIQLSIAL